MGRYAEYLDKNLDFHALSALRKAQLKRISDIRGRDVLCYAADFEKTKAPISISFADLTPIQDQISNLDAKNLDFIIETPGGAGEIAESIVRTLHDRFETLGVIIPGLAMSAGTIMAMAGDEILMHPQNSALGPIDAQLQYQGKTFSAHALLEGFTRIKNEVAQSGALNKAYIPVLQDISPGDLEHAKNAQDFAKNLVKKWLAEYKFRNWETHSSTGKPVTDQDKQTRAEEIATDLCDHSKWKTHGRHIRYSDLQDMRLKITDFSSNSDLDDAIQRYHVLLRMTFASTDIYKIIETPTSQILRFQRVAAPPPPVAPPPAGRAKGARQANQAELKIQCQCNTVSTVQANLNTQQPISRGRHPYPKDDIFTCPTCGQTHNLADARLQLEAQSGKKVVK